MTTHNQVLGRRGERLAEEFFVSGLGARLLERNFRIEYGEVDLLFEHEGELVAVEVKTRDVHDIVEPEECIRRRQLVRIERALATYAMDNEFLELPWRIDVVLVVVEPDGIIQRFDHLRSVYPG